jgi:WD40 repeat protein
MHGLINTACINSEHTPKTESPIISKDDKATILWAIDFSPDGKFYAIGGDDGLLRVYSALVIC